MATAKEDDRYEVLIITSVDSENETTVRGMYRDMTVERFKSAVVAQLRDPRATATRLRLFSLGEEMSEGMCVLSYRSLHPLRPVGNLLYPPRSTPRPSHILHPRKTKEGERKKNSCDRSAYQP